MRRFCFFILLPLFVVTSFAASAEEDVMDQSPVDVYESFDDADQPSMTIRVIDSTEPIDVFVTGEQVYTAAADDVGVVTQTLEPITPSNTTGFKKVLISVIGNYESIVTDYRYQNTNGTWQYLREVQPDYVWLSSAGIFALLLWCVFRMAGGIFCRK